MELVYSSENIEYITKCVYIVYYTTKYLPNARIGALRVFEHTKILGGTGRGITVASPPNGRQTIIYVAFG